jgi:hypothetical protein
MRTIDLNGNFETSSPWRTKKLRAQLLNDHKKLAAAIISTRPTAWLGTQFTAGYKLHAKFIHMRRKSMLTSKGIQRGLPKVTCTGSAGLLE